MLCNGSRNVRGNASPGGVRSRFRAAYALGRASPARSVPPTPGRGIHMQHPTFDFRGAAAGARRALVLGAAAALALCATPFAVAQGKGEIRIAHVYSKTGPLEAYAKQ